MADIQLLIADEGNKEALASLIDSRYTTIQSEELTNADLYLVDGTSLHRHREALQLHKRDQHPVFSPVVLIRRPERGTSVDLPAYEDTEPPLLVNDVVTAPVREPELVRTIENLLARRSETAELVTDLRAQNEELVEEQRKYQTLVEESEDGIVVAQDGAFVFVNERMTEISGRDVDDLTGLPVGDIFAEPDGDLVGERYAARVAGEQPPKQYEAVIETPDGLSKDVELRASRISYRGQPAVLAIVQDITERKERENELRRFKNAVEHAGHAVMITGPDGDIEYVNSAFEEMTGYSADEAIGAQPQILKSGEHGPEFFEELWETIIDGDVWTAEVVNKGKSGKRFIVNQTIAPIEDEEGDMQGFVAIQDEITGRRIREQQLTVFARVLRHNLRNKAAAVKGHADILDERLEDDDLAEHLDVIQNNIQSLIDVSEKAHHVRQIIADSMESDADRDLISLLDSSIERIAESYPAASLALEGDISEEIPIDARVALAFQELLDNAVKHAEETPPDVAVGVRRNGSTATVTIEDNGPGLPDQEQRVIEVGTENSLQHASGLGIWFAYWLLSYVGGDIDIEADDSGTTVQVTVPVRGGES